MRCKSTYSLRYMQALGFLFFPLFPGFYHRDEDEGCRHQQGDYCRPINTLGASQHDVAEGQPEQDDADAL